MHRLIHTISLNSYPLLIWTVLLREAWIFTFNDWLSNTLKEENFVIFTKIRDNFQNWLTMKKILGK